MTRKIERSTSTWAVLERCETHPDGCYIGLDVAANEDGAMAVIDFDAKGNVVGIEFPYGIDKLPRKEGGARPR